MTECHIDPDKPPDIDPPQRIPPAPPGTHQFRWRWTHRPGMDGEYLVDTDPTQSAGGPMARDEMLCTSLVVWRAWLEQMEAPPQISAGDRQADREAA